MTRYVASYRRQLALCTSERECRFASVVQWPNGEIAVGVKWSRTSEGARDCLTEQQEKSGAKVIDVVRAIPQPETEKLSEDLSRLLGF